MIHVSIPDVAELVDLAGSKYEAFNIYLNGSYHSSIRYSNLLRLRDAIKKAYGNTLNLPEFPSKKIILSEKALEERKSQLHRYIQAVIQHPVTSNHAIVVKFFLEAQVDSFRPTTSHISVDVYSCNGSKVAVKCDVACSTSAVIQKYGDTIHLEPSSAAYFGLFIVDDVKSKTETTSRWLRDFESPYISLHNLNQSRSKTHQIAIKRCYWDLTIENRLITTDHVATGLIFAQAVRDVSFGLVAVSPDVLQRLKALQKSNSIREYLKVCALQPSYGYWKLDQCLCDYPNPDTRVELKIGKRQLVIRYNDVSHSDPVESVFKTTRIRVWKIVNQPSNGYSMRFEFEFLMARDHYEWIVLYTNQAVLLSQCLQSMGAEILREKRPSLSPQKSTSSAPVVRLTPAATSRPLSNADERPVTSSSTTGDHSDAASTQDQQTASSSTPRNGHHQQDTTAGETRYESFSEVLTAASSRRPASGRTQSVLTNDAFNTITDDDL